MQSLRLVLILSCWILNAIPTSGVNFVMLDIECNPTSGVNFVMLDIECHSYVEKREFRFSRSFPV